MFKPKVIEEHQSKYSGTVRLMQTWGYKYVATGVLTQSGGLVRDVWRPVLQKYGQKNKSWLILGLATGTVAKMISDKYSPIKIVGVEIDPVMLDLGRRYFNLDSIPNLEIHQLDARRYILDAKEKFDLILVDLYLGDQLPDFIYSQKFLSTLRNIGNLIIINHLFYDDAKKAKAHALIKSLESRAHHVVLHRVLTNLMIICSWTGIITRR